MKLKEVFIIREGTDENGRVQFYLTKQYAKMLVLLLAESDDPKIQKIAQAIVKQINT